MDYPWPTLSMVHQLWPQTAPPPSTDLRAFHPTAIATAILSLADLLLLHSLHCSLAFHPPQSRRTATVHFVLPRPPPTARICKHARHRHGYISIPTFSLLFLYLTDGPSMVFVNILIRSISKISDLDMVSHSSHSTHRPASCCCLQSDRVSAPKSHRVRDQTNREQQNVPSSSSENGGECSQRDKPPLEISSVLHCSIHANCSQATVPFVISLTGLLISSTGTELGFGGFTCPPADCLLATKLVVYF